MTNSEAVNLLMNSEYYGQGYGQGACDVLDKIRADIERVIQEETVIDNSGGEYERTISYLDPDDVFEILDKYRAESEKLK